MEFNLTNRTDEELTNFAADGAPVDGWEGEGFLYFPNMKHNLGIPRNKMPQIWGNKALVDVVHWLTDKYKVRQKKVPLSALKPSQNQMDNEKIRSKMKDVDPDESAYIVSNSKHLVDSHHDWAAAMEKFGGDKMVDVYEVNLETKKLLEVLNKMRTTKKAD